MLSITFLYPSRQVGGAQLLFVRLAIELSKYDYLKISVVDYSDGYLKSQLTGYNKILILPYINDKVLINEETVVVTPLSNFADLKRMIKGDFAAIKFILWSIHPTNLLHVFTGNGRRYFVNKQLVKGFFEKISETGNLVYMDEANFLAAKDLVEIEKKPEYLQIPLEIKNYNLKEKNRSNKISIAWLGRISYDKVYSVIKIIDEIKLLSDKFDIVFHVIGTGERFDQLESYLKISGISYVLKGILEGENLSAYMIENIDLGVAMGTSCMEFASRRIPVFLVDYSEEKFPSTVKYNWLFETEDFTLGSHINSVTKRNHTFLELINGYENDDAIGKKCYQYVVNNHDIKVVALQLIERCKKLKHIELTQFNRMQKILNPPLYNFFYYSYKAGKKKFSNIFH